MTVEVKDPIPSEDPPTVQDPPAEADPAGSAVPEASGNGEGAIPEGQSTWFVPGRFKTEKDALMNVIDVDKRMGGIAKKMDDIEKLLKKPDSGAAAAPTGSEIDPETGKPYTRAQIKEQWDEWLRTDPTEATLALFDLQAKQNKGQMTAEMRATLTWDAFLAANPDMGSEENRKMLQEVLVCYPVLTRKTDCLIKAKEIVLTSGADVEEKYHNWLLKDKKKGDPPPEPPPAIPGQGTTGKGGKGMPKDPFFTNKDGSSIFG